MSDSDSEDDLGAFAFLATTIVVDDDEQAQEEAKGLEAARSPKRTRRPTRAYIAHQLENQEHKRRRK